MKTLTLHNSDGKTLVNVAVESWSMPQDDPFAFGSITLVPVSDLPMGGYVLREADGRVENVFVNADTPANTPVVALAFVAGSSRTGK